ncbi:putative membrane protein [Bacillus cereus]|uniref:Putative membrane protein n=1 Tax=Bacillus cereus TaxID=1396 RepID=A0A164DTT0_BACCE|nr:putative membrane protein [Bacillus cereus]
MISIGVKSFLKRLNNEENDNIKISPIVYLSGLGYIIGQICIGSLSQNGLATVLILVFSLLAVVFSISGAYICIYIDLKKVKTKLGS